MTNFRLPIFRRLAMGPWLLLLTLLTGPWRAVAQTDNFELPPTSYSSTAPKDAVTALQARMVQAAFLPPKTDRELVQWFLRELHVPAQSQVLVFSKTSFQRLRITPEHPRAIYFTDDCYIGWVPRGLMEVAAIDPRLGPVFYSVDPAAFRANEAEGIRRNSECLSCHGGTFVRDIPGLFVRSVFPNSEGEPLLGQGTKLVDFRTPISSRWGGWYVTGKHGTALHQGNVTAREENGRLVVDFHQGANVSDLSKFFDTRPYLADSSDIVALLVLEHQTAMQNSITRAGINCRKMLDYQKGLQRDLKESVTDDLVYDSVKGVFDHVADDLVRDLLFVGEAELPPGLAGSPAFQQAFLANARRTPQGDSLKDFCLNGHIFRNRCSYMIYSDAFLQLPDKLKQRVYSRLARILMGGGGPEYAAIDPAERRRIVVILQATHPEMAAVLADWRRSKLNLSSESKAITSAQSVAP